MKDCLDKITVSSRHLLSLVNEVLDMSRIESGKISLSEERFHLADLAQNLQTIIRPSVRQKGQEFSLHMGPSRLHFPETQIHSSHVRRSGMIFP